MWYDSHEILLVIHRRAIIINGKFVVLLTHCILPVGLFKAPKYDKSTMGCGLVSILSLIRSDLTCGPKKKPSKCLLLLEFGVSC